MTTRPAPSPTLFPYTTLFRSPRRSRVGAGGRPAYDPGHPAAATGHADRGDRKSTRLNSSHRCISYAVFCLKKKLIVGQEIHIDSQSGTDHIDVLGPDARNHNQ